MNPRFRAKRFARKLSRLLAWGAALPLGGWFGLALVPVPPALLWPPAPSLELTDRHGATLREVRTNEQFGRDIPFEQIPPRVIHAMLAAEDKRFFDHCGIDFLASARALAGNATKRRVTSGASTITQQLVKLAEPRPRTWRTKVIEAATALRLEQGWTKEQILAAYLNRVDFGNLNTGIGAAAGFYFGKPLADLTDGEAAFLAGLPKNPTHLNPHRHFAAAQRRQRTVLSRMQEAGWLAAEAFERACAEPLRLQPPRRTFAAPHFVDLILRERPRSGGAVRTTLDLGLQQRVERVIREQLAPLRSRNVSNAAVVVIDNASAGVLALAGSEDYFAPGSGQVNGAWARRSPGSALKPFTYLLALERGATAATVVADVPASFATSTGIYRPENFGRHCHGPVRYRTALANSLNIPAVRVLASLGGAAPLRERLQRWGLTTLDRPAEHYGLGLTIGNADVRLLELTDAYAALARLGRYEPFRLTFDSPAASEAPPDSAAAWLIADILSDNEARARAFGRQSALRFDFPVACKTGTSTDFRDNWAMGYTPEFTVGVWVGNFDGSPMREVSGAIGAGPILHAIFKHLRTRFGTTWYARPAEVIERDVHPLTGKLLAAPQADGVREKFLRAHLPAIESAADYDANGRAVLGADYADWMANGGNSPVERVAPAAATGALRVITPVPGTTFVLDPDVPSSARIPLVARGSSAVAWRSDSLVCGDERGKAFAFAAEGRHRLTAHDAQSGETRETWIVVKAL